jgi:hypothetical protein
MRLQHKGQKYRKWRVIKWQRAQAAARLLPCWDRPEEDILAQIRFQREIDEKFGLFLAQARFQQETKVYTVHDMMRVGEG